MSFPEFDTEPLEPIEVPPRPDLWIIVGIWGGDWTIPSKARGPWTSRALAETAARKVQAAGWQCVSLVRIPGTAQAVGNES